jgi:hypothetical protein
MNVMLWQLTVPVPFGYFQTLSVCLQVYKKLLEKYFVLNRALFHVIFRSIQLTAFCVVRCVAGLQSLTPLSF